MKSTNGKLLSAFLDIFMLLLLGVTVGVLLGLPWVTKAYMRLVKLDYLIDQKEYYMLLTMLYISGVLAAVILMALRHIFKTCKLDNPFVYNNVKHLKIISIASGLVGITFVLKLFVLNSIMTLIVIFIFIIAALFAWVLAEVFEKAVAYKEENDFTI